MKNKKGSKGIIIIDAIIMVILIVVLIPIIVTFSAGTQQCLEDETSYLQTGYNICSNMSVADETGNNVSSTNSLSVTERLMLSLISLFIVLAFIFTLVKSTGLINKKE